ncbi:MAG: hypothetical protein Q9225_004502 [Loekoesia sp. 1 TL-2023]
MSEHSRKSGRCELNRTQCPPKYKMWTGDQETVYPVRQEGKTFPSAAKTDSSTRLALSPQDPEARKAERKSTQPPAFVNFECPDCGLPVYCSEKHWMDDYESHSEICDTLRQANEDDHDLHSGRYFPEFEYPGPQYEEILVNMTNWDTYLYTRQYNAINEDRSMRQATRLLTYPVTIASIIHELSPYNIRAGGRLTVEGLKSLSALRYNLHPPRSGSGLDIKGLRLSAPPVRIFILGARAESSIPRNVWIQLEYLFTRCRLHLIFIGPESMANRDAEFPLPERTPANPFGGIVEDRLSNYTKITTFVEYYHTMHKANYFQPFDPYFDCFVLFHPGLGHPASVHEWEETLPQLLETKVPVICTGYTDWDMQRDKKWVEEKMAGEVDMLLEPGENIFRSLRWDLNDMDPGDLSCGNWGVWAFRGKRHVHIFHSSLDLSLIALQVRGDYEGLVTPIDSSTTPTSNSRTSRGKSSRYRNACIRAVASLLSLSTS